MRRLCWLSRHLLVLVALNTSIVVTGQESVTLSGYITDKASGETLIGAGIALSDDSSIGTSTNIYGWYSLSLPPGNYQLVISYIGYGDLEVAVDLHSDQKVDIELLQGVAIQEVVISDRKANARDNVEGTQMGTISLPVTEIKKLPAIFGEVDILKTLQLLPGVISSGEGSTGFNVRGGGADQNLVLLDDAVVYNTGHLLGFFSVFNADAIKTTTLIKGSVPAQYGGRLSSVVDIQMKEGNDKHYSAEGGIGLVSSRLTLQGPIAREKASFIVSARRTYALDLAQPLIDGTSFEGTNYYFYDLNAKVNYKIGSKDRIYLSTYIGQDALLYRQPTRDFNFDLPYGNKTATLRYNHLFSDRLFANLSLVYNDYRFRIDGAQDDFSFVLRSGVEDYSAKLDLDYYPNPKHRVKYGAIYTWHTLTPNTASASNGEIDFGNDFPPKKAHETAIYIQDEIKLTKSWTVNAGLRYAWFTQVGPYDSVLDGQSYDAGDAVVTYQGLEPRINTTFITSATSSIKAGYAWTNQYLHLVSNSSTTLPTDIWVPSSDLVRPQRSHQYAIGYFQNLADDDYETSVEVYYKKLSNQVDYADDYVDDITRQVEESFVFGDGRAYGLECYARKNSGRLSGWIGYTISRTERSFDDIEEGRWYPTVFDRTHDLSVVANYQLNDRFDFGAIFIYGTGRAFTPIQDLYLIDGGLNLRYGPRNSERLADYHRLDLSVTYTPRPRSTRSWQGSWTLSIYNTYNRLNPFFLNYGIDGGINQGSFSLAAEQVTIFPIIPSITYNFKWSQAPRS